MSNELSRRDVLSGAAAVVAAAALPGAPTANSASFVDADLIGQVWWSLADPGIRG